VTDHPRVQRGGRQRAQRTADRGGNDADDGRLGDDQATHLPRCRSHGAQQSKFPAPLVSDEGEGGDHHEHRGGEAKRRRGAGHGLGIGELVQAAAGVGSASWRASPVRTLVAPLAARRTASTGP
jgi:hypothetical protein